MQEPASTYEPAAPGVRPHPAPRARSPRHAHTGLGLLIAGPLIGLLLVGALSFATINEVSVGGPQDNRVTQARALVADTTLPSQNLTGLRGSLLLLTTRTTATEAAGLRAAVDRADLQYREGHAYWDTHLGDPVLRDSLLVEAHEPVATLFRIVHERLWPAMDRGDTEGAAVIVREQLMPLLDRHELAMARVSELADDELAATSTRADEAIVLRTRLFGALLAGVMVLVAIAAVVALRLTRRDERPTIEPTEANETTGTTAPGVTTEAPAAAVDHPIEDEAPDLVTALGTPLDEDLAADLESSIELTH